MPVNLKQAYQFLLANHLTDATDKNNSTAYHSIVKQHHLAPTQIDEEILVAHAPPVAIKNKNINYLRVFVQIDFPFVCEVICPLRVARFKYAFFTLELHHLQKA